MTLKPSIAIEWARNGINVKPDDAKIDSGWIAEKPPFQNENWLQNRSDLWMKSTEERGTPEWDPQIIYGKGARVHFAGIHWASLQISNIATAPVADAGWWINVNEISSPVGAYMEFALENAPYGWLFCDGSEKDRVIYARLFSKIGSIYGDGDGISTFNLPQRNGLVARCVDAGSGVDPDAGTRTDRGDGTIGDAVGTLQSDQYKSHTHPIGKDNSGVGAKSDAARAGAVRNATGSGIDPTGGAETRMKNINVLVCIKW